MFRRKISGDEPIKHGSRRTLIVQRADLFLQHNLDRNTIRRGFRKRNQEFPHQKKNWAESQAHDI